jgi:tRNA dimethylallyltransferase
MYKYSHTLEYESIFKNMSLANKKAIVILGSTSSGKSEVAIRLAKEFNGEIISADSRQVYRGLDIGSGKEPEDNSKLHSKNQKENIYWSGGIPHYGINIVSPRTEYNAAKFKKYADRVIANIISRRKIPIICGGTGFWIKAVVDNVSYPEVKPDPALRKKMLGKNKEELFAILKKLDSERAKTIDQNNPARLIRAIEICQTLGKVPPLKDKVDLKENLGSSTPKDLGVELPRLLPKFLQIGIHIPKELLYANIKKRLEKRFEAGMIEEVEKLRKADKLSWKRLESFGLGYRLIPKYLREEISEKEELFEKILLAERDYAKRQMTWFQKDQRIMWLESYEKIENEVRLFLEK